MKSVKAEEFIEKCSVECDGTLAIPVCSARTAVEIAENELLCWHNMSEPIPANAEYVLLKGDGFIHAVKRGSGYCWVCDNSEWIVDERACKEWRLLYE